MTLLALLAALVASFCGAQETCPDSSDCLGAQPTSVVDIMAAATGRSSSVIKQLPLSFPFATQSPFLFAVWHRDAYPAGRADLSVNAPLHNHRLGMDFANPEGWSMYHGETVPGFPQHPHRGFETVTVCRVGETRTASCTGKDRKNTRQTRKPEERSSRC
eukprot:m.119986 g.119986  ORF g.119986 m.119986 type:complete len:160 (+) comp16488_c0_seq1:157-636(+)